MKTTDSTARIKGYLQALKLNRIAGALDEELAMAARDATTLCSPLDSLNIDIDVF